MVSGRKFGPVALEGECEGNAAFVLDVNPEATACPSLGSAGAVPGLSRV